MSTFCLDAEVLAVLERLRKNPQLTFMPRPLPLKFRIDQLLKKPCERLVGRTLRQKRGRRVCSGRAPGVRIDW